MEHPIIVNDDGQIYKKRRGGVRPSLPYQGIARRALNSPVTYDREIDVSAICSVMEHPIIIDDDGNITTKQSYHNRVFGGRVMMPTFEIAANPTIKITDVKRRRFNVIDRAVQKARDEIASDIDNEIYKALESINSKK